MLLEDAADLATRKEVQVVYIRYTYPLVFTTQLRKVGNSWVVTVPREELESLGIPEGATVTVEVREARVSVEPVLATDLREASAWALEHGRAGLDALA